MKKKWTILKLILNVLVEALARAMGILNYTRVQVFCRIKPVSPLLKTNDGSGILGKGNQNALLQESNLRPASDYKFDTCSAILVGMELSKWCILAHV